MSTVERTRQLCEKPIADLGFELYTVQYKKEVGGMELTLFIDRGSEPVTLQDCERVSNAVEQLIEDADVTSGAPYNLCVSSLGLDWPIKTERDMERNRGKAVEIKLYSKIDGKKEFVGELKDWNEATLTLTIASKTGNTHDQTFTRKDIANIAPHIKF
jgi:ribosome maturation factor RimP